MLSRRIGLNVSVNRCQKAAELNDTFADSRESFRALLLL